MTLEAVIEYMRVHHEFTPSYVHPAKPPSGPALGFSKVMSFYALSNKLIKSAGGISAPSNLHHGATTRTRIVADLI